MFVVALKHVVTVVKGCKPKKLLMAKPNQTRENS